MISKKTYIPARPRNKKIVPNGRSSTAPIVSSGGSSHSHNNKSLLDLINQGNIDVLSKLFIDAEGNLYTTENFYSQQEISAYGIGSGGGGGGGDISKLLSWAGYTSAMADFYVSASLLVPFYNDMQSRVSDLEDGGGGSNVTWGTESGGYIPLTVEGVSKSVALSTHTHSQYALSTHTHSGVYEPAFTKNTAFNKDFGTTSGTVAEGNHTHSQYALTTHNHSGVYEPVFTKNEAFNKDFGTTSGTVAEGNDSRIMNGQTAYGWGNHASEGYALASELANYVTLATTQTISGAKTFSTNLTASVSVTTPKVIFAAAGWSLEQSGTELQMKYNGTAKMRFLSGGSIVATQEITAYS